MWGLVTRDASMEARGTLMLGVMARTMGSYFLLRKDNMIQPKEFIANKVTGIVSELRSSEITTDEQLFDNKVDHTTYFGTNYEYIQGIHMLPLNPSTMYTRSNRFIAEEWDVYFAPGRIADAANVAGGWRGILYGNYACVNARAAWKFFTQPNFDVAWLDGGASRTWYMAFAACKSSFQSGIQLTPSNVVGMASSSSI